MQYIKDNDGIEIVRLLHRISPKHKDGCPSLWQVCIDDNEEYSGINLTADDFWKLLKSSYAITAEADYIVYTFEYKDIPKLVRFQYYPNTNHVTGDDGAIYHGDEWLHYFDSI